MEAPNRRTSQLRTLGDELQGVQRIMFDNIDAVLQRGELISGVSARMCYSTTTNAFHTLSVFRDKHES